MDLPKPRFTFRYLVAASPTSDMSSSKAINQSTPFKNQQPPVTKNRRTIRDIIKTTADEASKESISRLMASQHRQLGRYLVLSTYLQTPIKDDGSSIKLL